MSCGVRYEFSLVTTPKKAQVLDGDTELIGTPHDAEEAGPADERGSTPDSVLPGEITSSRQRAKA